MRTRGTFFNYCTVNGHAPTEMSDDEEKDGFFDALETAYNISPRNYIKIVIDEFNAQAGKEAINFPTIGNYSLHNLTKDNGSQVIQFAVSRNMIIGSTFHLHRDIHKITWRSLDGVTFNQIDQLLFDRRHKSNLMDVRSYRSANIESNRSLVTVRLRARISNVKQVNGIRTSKYNVSILTPSEVAEQYRQQTEEKLNHINLLTWTTEKNCGRDVKQSLFPKLKGCWVSWNQQIKERGLIMNARLPQKTKTKHVGICNKDMVPEA